MPKVAHEYRADHVACPLNAGKLGQVRALVLAMRKTAVLEAILQWDRFYRGRWAGFESTAKTGWTRPWVADGRLNTTFSQMVMAQVAGSLKGHFGNLQNTYTALVSGSTLPASVRHQLHSINRRQAWFWPCPVQVKQAVEQAHPETGVVHMEEKTVRVPEDVRALARTLIRRSLSQHRKPHFRNFQPQLDQRACFVQASHTAQHPYWLQISTLADRHRIQLPLAVHPAFLKRNAQGGLYQALARESLCPEIGREHGPNFLAQMKALDTAEGLDRNPHTSDLTVPNTVRLMLSKDQATVTLALVSDMRSAFEHQAATYVPKSGILALDLGLSTFLASSDGDLLGRGWMETLTKFDRLITGIARHRQGLGLKVASDRYRHHVGRLRGYLKTEIHRILNRLIDRKRPTQLVLEDVNFQSPKLSRRLNRLIQNFGQGVLTEKLTQIERQFGITVERRIAAYTSQECHSCGYVDPRNRVSQAKFMCLFCNRCSHADVQAARVLRDRRSIASVPTSRLSRQRLLTDRVRLFGARHTRPRGGPADPRFSNPYFEEWEPKVRYSKAVVELSSLCGLFANIDMAKTCPVRMPFMVNS